MNYLGISYDIKNIPVLDPGFIPFGVWVNAYLKEATRPFSVAVERENGKISVVVHNREYRLTHLLEHGHKARDGSRAKAIPHIAPVEEWAVSEAMKAIEKAVKE